MKITVLVENTVSTKAPAGLLGQHGLSMLLEIPGSGRILFDTGQTDILLENLLLMDILPDSIDYIVLSHGHFDHCGGLNAIFKARQLPATVFAGPNIFSARYARSTGGGYRHIGIPYTKEHLASSGAEFIFTYGPCQMRENIWLSGPIPRTTEFEAQNTTLLDIAKQPDGFSDEIAIYLVQPEGLVVVTGCSHRGLINTIKYGQQVTGVEKVHAVVGGSHLEPASLPQQEETIKVLREMEPDIIALNHCTGIQLQAQLQSVFGARFVAANAGSIINL